MMMMVMTYLLCVYVWTSGRLHRPRSADVQQGRLLSHGDVDGARAAAAAARQGQHRRRLLQPHARAHPRLPGVLHLPGTTHTHTHTHTHTRLTALFPGLPGWAGARKVKPIRISLKQETVSGSGIHWAVCKSASLSRQITTPAPRRSVFTGRVPFLPPNQQRQSTEGTGTTLWIKKKQHTYTPNSCT